MASGYTVIEYGNAGELVISSCLTRRFDQSPVWDDSGTDLLYWRFTVSVTGYCHSNPAMTASKLFIQPMRTSSNAAESHIAQRSHLAPRQKFVMRVGVSSTDPDGTVLLSAEPNSGLNLETRTASISGKDVNNGPRCNRFEITQVTGNNIFRVEAEFEVCKVECNEQGQAPNNLRGVLSNRWSCIDDIDQDFYTIRTYQGRLRLSSANFSPHAFRDLVVPPLQQGMRRAKMTFAASPDGLNLDYTIVDQEVAFAAPYPATSWAVKHTETTADGIMGVSEISIYLAGDRYVNKKELIRLALAIVEAKCIGAAAAAAADKRYKLDQLSITDETGERSSIAVNARVTRQNESLAGSLRIALGQLGKPIDAAVLAGYDYRNSSFGSRGKPGTLPPLNGPIPLIGIFKSYLQTPCNDLHGIAGDNSSASGSTGTIQQVPGPSVDAYVTDGTSLAVTDDPSTSSGHKNSVYIYWQVESIYATNNMSAVMPVASGFSSSSDSGGGTTAENIPTARRVILAPPQMTRTLRIKGERVGEFPVIPTATDYTDANGIEAWILESRIRPGAITQSASGQPVYRVDAEYVWGLSRALRPGEQWRIGNNPWDVRGLQRTNGSMFLPESGIVSPGQSPGQQ